MCTQIGDQHDRRDRDAEQLIAEVEVGRYHTTDSKD